MRWKAKNDEDVFDSNGQCMDKPMLKIPVRCWPWYHKLWGYPFKGILGGIMKILGLEE